MCKFCQVELADQCIFDMSCLCCISRLIMNHSKPMRALLIQHWAERHGHKVDVLKAAVTAEFERRKQA
jgi:hypothetical protein